MEVEEALRRCGGAARWTTLRGLGTSERALQAAVRLGSVQLGCRGAYALPGTEPAFVAAVDLRGVVSHASAARLHGLDLHRPPATIHVTVPSGARQRLPGIRVHTSDLAPEDRETSQPITTVRRTLYDCARTMPLLDGVVILDGAVRNRLATMGNLRAMARAARGPGSAALRRAVAHVDAMAGSPLESALRLLLHLLDADLQSQVYVDGIGWVDFLLDGWLAIEGDGFAYHSDRRSYRKDRYRGNGLAVGGYVLLRFTWEDVRLRPGYVLSTVAQVLARAPRR